MTQQYNSTFAPQYNSNFNLTIPWSNVTYQFALAENTALSVTLPGTETQKYSLRFNYNSSSNVFVGYNVSPTVPGAGDVTAQPFVDYKPGYERTQRYAKGGDVIYFITPDAAGAYVGLRALALP